MKHLVFFIGCIVSGSAIHPFNIRTMVPETNIHAQHVIYFENPKLEAHLSQRFLKKMIEIFNVTIFLETGTYTGDSTLQAAPLFKEIHTIELSKELCLKAAARLKNYTGVTLYWGDSSQVLPVILPQINGRILFWLDGHYSDGCTAKGNQNTPILQELNAIKNAHIHDAIIMIDDIRLFREPLQPITQASLQGYPTLECVMEHLYEINTAYKCLLIGDVLLAFPQDYRISPSPVAQACMISRLYQYFTQDEVQKAENIIVSTPHIELQTIRTLSQFLYDPNAQKYGFTEFYLRWHQLAAARKGYLW